MYTSMTSIRAVWLPFIPTESTSSTLGRLILRTCPTCHLRCWHKFNAGVPLNLCNYTGFPTSYMHTVFQILLNGAHSVSFLAYPFLENHSGSHVASTPGSQIGEISWQVVESVSAQDISAEAFWCPPPWHKLSHWRPVEITEPTLKVDHAMKKHMDFPTWRLGNAVILWCQGQSIWK